MPRLFTYLRWRMLGPGLLAVIAFCPHSSGGGQQPGGRDDAPKQYLGAQGCATCHDGQNPRFKTDFVQMDEYKTWKDKDKHSQAYAVLLTERSKTMGRLIGIKDVTSGTDPANACIKCHAVAVAPEQQFKDFDIKDGVSCDACHGPASSWVDLHWKDRKWRDYTPKEKQDKFGMLDLRDPAVRSQMCFSCHIGNAAEGKVLTHAMYAAGHPPLPSVEIATFSEQEPRHWRHLRDVPFLKDTKDDKIKQTYRFETAPFEQTRVAAVSAAVALAESAKLLAAQAKQGYTADPNKSWPELTHFDCTACHHDLKTKSWRQQRGYTGSPGRPQMRSWPTALVKVLLRDLGEGDAALDQKMKPLHEAFDAQPFGRPDAIANAGGKLAAWANELTGKLEAKKWDEDTAKRLLKALAQTGKDELLDYDSARQIGWAFRVIYDELPTKPVKDKEIRDILAELDKALKLDLPSGTGKSILKELVEGLEKVNEYSPEKLQQQLARLAESLNP